MPRMPLFGILLVPRPNFEITIKMNLARMKLLLAYGRTLPLLGPKALFHNLRYRIGLKTGWYEKTLPESSWRLADDLTFLGAPWRRAQSERLQAVLADHSGLIESADAVIEGRFTGFSWCPLALSGNLSLIHI